MPTLEVENLLPQARVYVAPGQSLLAALHAAGHDWRHQCGAKGRCTTCRLTIRAGAEWLAPLTDAEQRFRDLGRLPVTDRLTCQTTFVPTAPPAAEVGGAVPPACRLPHVAYQLD